VAHLFFDSEDDALLQHGESWLEEPSLLSALSAGGAWLALARGERLWVCGEEEAEGGRAVPLPPGERATALCFATFARPGGAPPDAALLLGTASGRLLVLSPAGEPLLSQRAHDSAVRPSPPRAPRSRARSCSRSPCARPATARGAATRRRT